MFRVVTSLALSTLLAAAAAGQGPPPGAPAPGRVVNTQAPGIGQPVALMPDLAAVPANAALVVRVNVPAVLKDRTVARLLGVAAKAGPDAIGQAFAGFVPDPLTVDRITTAVVFQAPKDRPARNPADAMSGVAIAHTSVPFDPVKARDSLLGPGSKETKAGAVAVFTDARGDAAVAFPDAQTVVFGPADVVAAALAAPVAAGSPLMAELLNPPAGADAPVLIAAARANIPDGLVNELLPPQLRSLAGADTMGLAFVRPADLGGDAAVAVRFTYPSEAAVGKAQQAITLAAADARAALAQGRADALKKLAGRPDAPAVRPYEQLPESAAALLQLAAVNAADEWLKDPPVARAGTVLTTTIAVPAELTPALVAAPAALGIALPAVTKVRAAASRSQASNNLKQIGLAMHGYNDTYGNLPTHAIYSKDGKPLLSWRVAMLPYIEQQALYNQFKLDEPWDSPNNKKLIPVMPRIYADPRVPFVPGMTYYKVFTGKNTVFDGPKKRSIVAISDGTSNTLLVAAGGDPVTWTKPDDIPFDVTKPVPDLFKPFPDLLVLFGDGSVRVLRFTKRSTDETDKILKLLIQPDDGMVIPNFDD